MSLSSIFNIGTSGLVASQAALRVTSDNIANVDTPGYIRKVADQQSQVTGGVGTGVSLSQVRLATDKFLQAAGLNAAAASGQAGVSADLLDRAQASFGDPTSANSFFGQLDKVFSTFTALSSGATDAAKGQAVGQVQQFLSQAQGIQSDLSSLGAEAETRLQGDVTTANSLLQQIDGLNTDISRATVAGGDATGLQNQQSGLVDQLSSLIGVRITQNNLGGVTVRSADGTALAGENGPATLRYASSGPGTGQLLLTLPGQAEAPAGVRIASGEIKGLSDLANTSLPALSDGLSSLVTGTVEALNQAHNSFSSAPAPQTLIGRSTGLTAAEAFGNITSGKTAVLVTDANGSVVKRVDVDFSVPSISVDGAAATSFTRSNFAGALNTALGASGSASFDAKGSLSISAASSANGIAIADDATTPVSIDGQGFSAAFGLNDLVKGDVPLDGATGLTAASNSGFTGALHLRVTAANGSVLRDVTVNAPAGGTVGALVSALNANTGGVGPYGAFALDSAGRLSFTGQGGATLQVVSDTTQRGSTGLSASQFFGLDATSRSARVAGLAVRSDIAADPDKLALAQVQAGATAGQTALYATDSSGADALAQAGQSTHAFDAAGGLAATSTSPSGYAAQLAAAVAKRADDASTAKDSAAAVATEASARRTATEGVNLDQELVSLTTYQQSYNASARLITTAKEMYDVLLNMF